MDTNIMKSLRLKELKKEEITKREAIMEHLNSNINPENAG
jgi:hypothetical protein